MLGAINLFLCVPSMVPRKWSKGTACVIFKNTIIQSDTKERGVGENFFIEKCQLINVELILELEKHHGGPMIRTPHFYCQEPGFDPLLEN